MDRFHIFDDVGDSVPQLNVHAAYAKPFIRDRLFEHKQYITDNGQDMPDIRNWKRKCPHE